MKNLTDFYTTVETGVDPRLDWMIYLNCVVMNIKVSKTSK